MNLAAFLSQLRRLDLQLWVEGDRLHYSAPPGVVTPELRAAIAARKAELIAFFSSVHDTADQISAPIQPVPRDGDLPLSVAQQQLWRLDRLRPGNPIFNIAHVMRLSGPLDLTALQRSIDEIVQRHETLRSTFPAAQRRPTLVIAPRSSVQAQVEHVPESAESESEAALQQLIWTAICQPFDLARGPLAHVTLLRLAEMEHVMVITMHQIIADSSSASLFSHEVMALYTAFSAGQPSPLPELAIQYVDVAAWQRRQLQGPIAAEQLAYWKGQLAGAPMLLDLPAGQRPRLAATPRARQELRIPKNVLAPLEALSQQHGTTVFMALLAVLQVLLHSYTGQTTLVIGTPTFGRSRKETEALIGPFASLLALRVEIGREPGFVELLEQVRATYLEAYEHQDLRFAQLVEELAPDWDRDRNPLTQVFLSLREPFPPMVEAGELRLHHREIYNETGRFDLALLFLAYRDGLHGYLDYHTGLFDAATAAWMADRFQELVKSISVAPEQRVEDLVRLVMADR